MIGGKSHGDPSKKCMDRFELIAYNNIIVSIHEGKENPRKMEKYNIHCNLVNIHCITRTFHQNHAQMLHKHEGELELFYIVRGAGQYMVDGRRLILREGNLVVCRPGVLHGEMPEFRNVMESCCVAVKGVSLESGEDVSSLLGELTHNPVLNLTGEGRKIYTGMLDALTEMFRASAEITAAENLLTRALLAYVLEKLLDRHHKDKERDGREDCLVYEVVRYLEEHFRENISLQELGKRFHISQSRLSHVFKEETGMSVLNYVLQLKLGEAQHLLMNTSRPVGEIGEELGFYETSHFNLMFKKYTGMTPSAYRQFFHDQVPSLRK